MVVVLRVNIVLSILNVLERDILVQLLRIEYDPNRNVRVALVVFKNGAKKYILLPDGLTVGDVVMAGAIS